MNLSFRFLSKCFCVPPVCWRKRRKYPPSPVVRQERQSPVSISFSSLLLSPLSPNLLQHTEYFAIINYFILFLIPLRLCTCGLPFFPSSFPSCQEGLKQIPLSLTPHTPGTIISSPYSFNPLFRICCLGSRHFDDSP